MSLRYLSICSGIEAASVAFSPLGWQPVAFAEIDKFPSRVLAHRYPGVPNLGDFTSIDVTKLGPVDVLVGGTPCQSFSVAGKRKSLADARGNLSIAYTELAHALARSNGLRWAIWENVPGVLSTPDNAFGCFLGSLVGSYDALCLPRGARRWPDAGMVAGPKARLAWRVLDAEYFGLAQRRRRVFVVAGFGDGADPAKVLFEPQGVQGNPSPCRKERQDLAPTIRARAKGGGGIGTDFELDGGLIAHSLRADGFDASEDGTGRGTPIVPICFSSKDHGADAATDLAPTMRAMGFDKSHANDGGQLAVASAPCRGGVAHGKGGAGGWAVRRLTPRLRECERLQGFPDDYTAIPGAADGPRYKAIGNSFAVPCVSWIGKRIGIVQRQNQASETAE